MQTLKEYIEKVYCNDINGFLTNEVAKQQQRVNEVFNNRQYLNGIHDVLTRKDFKWKNNYIKSTKLVLHSAKKILTFHDTYLLGKRPTINGTDKAVEVISKVYRIGKFNKCLYDVKRQLSRFGDCFVYLYKEGNNVKYKIIGADCGYPIFSEDTGEYIGFIEHYRVNSSKIGYYNLYTDDKVINFDDEGGYLKETSKFNNTGGLPIHFKNYNDYDDRFGRSDLEDIKPILNQLEDLYSKMIDGVYKLSLNPMGVMTGQTVTNCNVDKDMTGAVITLESGAEYKFACADMDSNSIKLLYDQLKEQLSLVGCVPSTVLGNSNIANVSEVSLNILYNMAEAKALEDTEIIRQSVDEMNERILSMLGINTDEEYVDMVFNYNKIIDKKELIEQLKTLFDMNSISVETILEKCGLEVDVTKEIDRLNNQKNEVDKVDNLEE